MATNVCTNPGAEVNTDGWSALSAMLSRNATDAVEGNACFQIENTSGAALINQNAASGNRPAVSAGDVWRIATNVKSNDTMSLVLRIVARSGLNGGGSFVQSFDAPTVVTNGAWQPTSVEATMPANALSIIPQVVTIGSTSGDIFLTDGWEFLNLSDPDAPRPSRVFVLGSPYNLGPLRVGRR